MEPFVSRNCHYLDISSLATLRKSSAYSSIIFPYAVRKALLKDLMPYINCAMTFYKNTTDLALT